jgi:hypothetical protein
MKKTSLLLVLGLALVLASAAAPKANAGVVVGIGVGTPVYPVRAYGYFGLHTLDVHMLDRAMLRVLIVRVPISERDAMWTSCLRQFIRAFM